MHTFIFPTKDTYITNINGLDERNFGIDEILNVSATVSAIKSISKYQTASISSSTAILENLVNFEGVCDAYFNGDTKNIIYSDVTVDTRTVEGKVNGNITLVSSSNCNSNFTTSNYSGNVTGSISAYVDSATLNGITYITEFIILDSVSGSVTSLSGSISGSSPSSVEGTVSGSLSGKVHNFSGSLYKVSGVLQGIVSGSYSYYNPRFKFDSYTYMSRALLKFDLTSISSSVHSGDITNPKFLLNLKTYKVSEIPYTYKIYAYPISQSWEMGNGRTVYNGSVNGVSWTYRDVNSQNGTIWYPKNKTTTLSDYLTNEANKEIAFGNGGGTWYYSVPVTFTQPTSSAKSPFFDIETSIPTFEDAYSSSLNANLTSSFAEILSGSMEYVLSSSLSASLDADSKYQLLYSIADSVYNDSLECISSSLNDIDKNIWPNCSTSSLYQIEHSASVLFLENLSSSIQNILKDTANAAYYSNKAYEYDLYLSGSVSSSNPIIYSELYSLLNNWSSAANISDSNSVYIYGVYSGFSSSLLNAISDQTYTYSNCVNSSVSSSMITSSIDLINSQFTSSVVNQFSSSIIYYFNTHLREIELETSASVAASLTQTFISSFYSDLNVGSSLIVSQSFSYESSDIKLDVSPIVKSWIAGCIPNEGIILLTSEELTTNTTSNGNIGFYSKETNTIYTPHLDVIWDDSVFDPEGLSPIDENIPFVITIKNLKKEYKHDSIVRINVFAREKYPLKNFKKATQQTAHLIPNYLPETTYFAIKDTETEEVILDFDDGTKISCDSNGNYFMLDMTGLPQERYFKILIKTEINGSVEVFDNNTYFKIVR